MASLSILHLEDQRVCAVKTRDDLASAKADTHLSFEVTHVETLKEALDALSERKFDAILADLGLPDSRGTETVTALRRAAATSPIVAFTAEDSTRHMLACSRAGADDYLVKGQSPSSLIVRALLNAIERRKTRSRLRTAQAKSTAIVKTVVDAIITFDTGGIILSANPSAEKMYGLRSDELIGRGLGTLISPAQRSAYTQKIRQLTEQRTSHAESIRFESEGIHGSGKTFPVNCTFCEITDGGPTNTYCAVVRDTSEEKARILEIREACERAEAATKSKSEFLANMSHELRTPLTAILGFAESLLVDHRSPDTEFVESVQTILRNGEHLTGLINDLLDLSKIEAGHLSIVTDKCHPFQLTNDVLKLLDVRAQTKAISLSADWPDELPRQILIDETRLRQVLINLIGNAIKFTSTGGVTVAPRLHQTPNSPPVLSWEIRDTGIGMDEKACAKIFEPFVQAEKTTSRRFGGTGLGLTITKRLVDMMGGNLSVSSKPGVGSTFTINFPLLDDSIDRVPVSKLQTHADKRCNSTDGPARSEEPLSIDNKLVLLAEDGVDNQRLISFILKKHGAVVDVVDNGARAFEAATQAVSAGKPYDIILMDMQMPVLDGYGATRKLRREGYTGPIIALTAHAMKGDREACLDAGCNEYATKPIDRDVLVRTVAAFSNHADPMQVQSNEARLS
ncbi:MAG: response regulator [Pirellulales bacterium]|nr:response regulator [Pirellulales bacterium]